MTMTDVRAAALGEFPAPPPCPSWCERDNDTKTRTTWRRTHVHLRTVPVRPVKEEVYVVLTASDTFYGNSWEARSIPQIELGPGEGTVFGDADSRFAVAGLLAVARLISPEVREAVQAAAQLVDAERSPAVTPAGEDQ